MGEHRSDGGLPGRRQVHPADSAHTRRAVPDGGERPAGPARTAGPGGPGRPGSSPALREAELEALIAAALIREGIDAEAEQRAVAAFRAAREAGAHRSAARRRDDWRARERRLPGRSLKATLSVLLASLTLGGAAVAAIGSVASTDDPGERGRPPAVTRAPGPSAGAATGGPAGSGSARPDRPGTARDTEAHCRAYERVGGRGRALGATAWQRLVEAAGGERNVPAYCAGQLAGARDEPAGTATPDRGKGTPGSAGSGNAGNAGAGSENAAGAGSGNAGSTGGSGNAGNGSSGDGRGTGAGNGDAGAGQSGSGTGRGGSESAARNSGEDAAGSGSSGGKGKPAQPDSRRP
ncbi:hypothetical protein ACIGAN_33410 [Streptomyces sp. NPDC085931]|uniref:hypothetical protein n=1 Tax=Streptomyces sp. NPDC085931 TaxID=3365740 RepID=UPI0037D86B27